MKKVQIGDKKYTLTKAVSHIEEMVINFNDKQSKKERNIVKLYLPYPISEFPSMGWKNYVNWGIIEEIETIDPETKQKKITEKYNDYHSKYTHVGDVGFSTDGTIYVCMCELVKDEYWGATVDNLLSVIQNGGAQK